MVKNLIIAFLLGLGLGTHAFATKVPDLVLSNQVDPDVREMLEDYIVPILNEGKVEMRVRSSVVTSDTDLATVVLSLDNSSVTKRLVISNGNANYGVNLTAL